jgi:aspartyl/glutamyl-tRNA(Asn/Gln) amidotransferase C subunit
MISREEILKLAALSRLSLSEEEVVKMQGEMTSILAYVDKLKQASANTNHAESTPALRNVLREDSNAHTSGAFTEKLIKAAPRNAETKDGWFVKVKKILGGSQ